MNSKSRLLKIGLYILSLFMWLHFSGNQVEAADWVPLENSAKVIEVTDGVIPSYNPNAVLLGLVGYDNEMQLYEGAILQDTYKLYQTKENIPFEGGDWINITKAGVYKGRYVDLQIRNMSLAPAYIYTLANGQILIYHTYDATIDGDYRFLLLGLRDHLTGEELEEVNFYLPMSNKSFGYTIGRYVKAFDKDRTLNYYVNSNDNFIKKNTYLDVVSSSQFDLLTSDGTSQTGQGQFVIYGNIGKLLEKPGSYLMGTSASSGQSAANLAFFGPTKGNPIPIDYDPLRIKQNAVSSKDGKTFKAEITMEQPLNEQSELNYIPSNDSFELLIEEKNTGFLNVSTEDFSLSVDGEEVPSNAYTLDVNQSGTKTNVSIQLTTAYLQQINNSTTITNKILEIKQKSIVEDNESKIKAAIEEGVFTMPISASLSYQFSVDPPVVIDKEILTPTQDVSLSLEPELRGNFKVYFLPTNTVVGTVPIENFFVSGENLDFPWDSVYAEYQYPNDIILPGSQRILFDLISETFKNKQVSFGNEVIVGSMRAVPVPQEYYQGDEEPSSEELKSWVENVRIEDYFLSNNQYSVTLETPWDSEMKGDKNYQVKVSVDGMLEPVTVDVPVTYIAEYYIEAENGYTQSYIAPRPNPPSNGEIRNFFTDKIHLYRSKTKERLYTLGIEYFEAELQSNPSWGGMPEDTGYKNVLLTWTYEDEIRDRIQDTTVEGKFYVQFIQQKLEATPVPQTVPLGTGNWYDLDLTKFVKDVHVGGETITDYNVLIKEFPNTERISDSEKIVLHIYDNNSGAVGEIEVPITVVWGNSLVLAELISESQQIKETSLALTIHSDNNNQPYLTASYGKLSTDKEETALANTDELYYTIARYDLSEQLSGLENAKLVQNSREVDDEVLVAAYGDNTPKQMLETAKNAADSLLKVNYGDVIRVYTKTNIVGVSYENEEPGSTFERPYGQGPFLTNAFLQVNDVEFWVVTPDGFIPMFQNQLQTKTVEIPRGATESHELYDSYYDSISTLFTIPVSANAQNYKYVVADGFVDYPKLDLDVGETSQGVVSVAQASLPTAPENEQKYLKTNYEVSFQGADDSIQIISPIDDLSFGTATLKSYTQTIPRENVNWGFGVKDPRYRKQPWRVMARIEDGFSSGEDELKGAELLLVNDSNETITLNEGNQEIYDQETPELDNTVRWTEADKGFFLKVAPGNIKKNAAYTSTIHFEILETPND